MKNMLIVAGVFTLFFAGILVWIDDALVNYLESRSTPVLIKSAPEQQHLKACKKNTPKYPPPDRRTPDEVESDPKGKCAS